MAFAQPLIEALSKSSETLVSVYGLSSSARPGDQMDYSASVPFDHLETIISEIHKDLSLHDLTGKYQVGPEGVDATHVNELLLARFLVNRAWKLNDVSKALVELRELIDANKSSYRFITLVSGIDTAECIKIGPRLWLSPIDNLNLVPNYGLKNFRFDVYGAPTAAIIEEIPYAPVFITQREIPHRASSVWRLDRAYKLANIIASATGGCVAVHCGCFEGNDRLPAGNPSTFLSNALGKSNITATQTAHVDEEGVRRRVSLYRRFRGELGPLDIALNRLNRSRSHMSIEDQVIDLGVATEVLLRFEPANKGQPREKGPITDLLVERAGELMADCAVSSDYYEKWTRLIYDTRSEAIHQGKLPSKIIVPARPGNDDHEINTYIMPIVAGAIVAEFVLKILELRKWPSWPPFQNKRQKQRRGLPVAP